jgi:hypothetical protein
MSHTVLASTLQRLCHAEQTSLISRLAESVVFVSWASADDADLLRRMVAEEHEHVVWMVELLDTIGESLTPFRPDAQSTSLHFLELHFLMPQVLAIKEQMIAEYSRSAGGVSYHPEAGDLIRRITARHDSHLSLLKQMSTSVSA